MGGELTLTSAPGAGSRFTLQIMLPEPMHPPAAAALARAITGYEGARRRLLLIDDDPAQLAILSGLLQPLGFAVATAAGGAAGLAQARAELPDAVLLDIQMPDQSGWDVAASLRALHGERVRIIMVSANAHEASEGGDGCVPHDAFITKPVEFQKLLDTLAAQLGLTWIGAATKSPEAPAPAPPVPRPGKGDPLPADFRADLRRLGQIGHVRGIARKLDELERAVPGAAPIAQRLRARADAFDFAAYLLILEEAPGG